MRRSLAATAVRDEARLRELQGRLVALDPDRVLARGYALLTDAAGHALTSVAQVRKGDSVDARLEDGELDLVVTETRVRDPRP
jgi:exodeoxyribonuclease VII large subunit